MNSQAAESFIRPVTGGAQDIVEQKETATPGPLKASLFQTNQDAICFLSFATMTSFAFPTPHLWF